MEDKENNNSDDLLNSSMFGSNEESNQMDSMFSSDIPQSEEAAFAEENIENTAESPAEIKEDIQNLNNEDASDEPKAEFDITEKEISENEEEGKPQAEEKTPLQVLDEDEEDDDTEEKDTPQGVVTVRPVKFKKFEATPPIRTIKKNLDIMQDVSMHVSVELGRTKLSIKEVMDFEAGSIVELNKIAGEQVEVFVNGKLVAKGEVIVIEDRFGVRITSTNVNAATVNP